MVILQSCSHWTESTLQQQPALSLSHGIYKQTHSLDQPTFICLTVLYNVSLITAQAHFTLRDPFLWALTCRTVTETEHAESCRFAWVLPCERFYLNAQISRNRATFWEVCLFAFLLSIFCTVFTPNYVSTTTYFGINSYKRWNGCFFLFSF